MKGAKAIGREIPSLMPAPRGVEREADLRRGTPMNTVRRKGKKSVSKYVRSLPPVSNPVSCPAYSEPEETNGKIFCNIAPPYLGLISSSVTVPPPRIQPNA